MKALIDSHSRDWGWPRVPGLDQGLTTLALLWALGCELLALELMLVGPGEHAVIQCEEGASLDGLGTCVWRLWGFTALRGEFSNCVLSGCCHSSWLSLYYVMLFSLDWCLYVQWIIRRVRRGRRDKKLTFAVAELMEIEVSMASFCFFFFLRYS